jgi:thioredoxin 1
MRTTTVTSVTDATFEEAVLRSPRPVLVEFWAQWCPPCKMLAPVLEAIAEERRDALEVVKLNIDESPAVTARYHVMSFPTTALFVGGVEQLRLIGAMPKGAILAELDEALPRA